MPQPLSVFGCVVKAKFVISNTYSFISAIIFCGLWLPRARAKYKRKTQRLTPDHRIAFPRCLFPESLFWTNPLVILCLTSYCPNLRTNGFEKTALRMSIKKGTFTSGQNVKPPFLHRSIVIVNFFEIRDHTYFYPKIQIWRKLPIWRYKVTLKREELCAGITPGFSPKVKYERKTGNFCFCFSFFFF